MNQTNWQEMLEECRERFGNAPRDFGSAELQHLKVAFSWLTRWVSRSDALCQPLAAQKKVFQTGTVVWGCVIQANMGLFEPGHQDLPGETVYSLAPDDTTPDTLVPLAERLAGLKGTQPASNPERHIADYLTVEFIRVFGLAVPRHYSNTQNLISTVMFARHHLPNTILSDRILPLVVATSPPHFAFVLPAVYWPQRLLDRWGAERPLLARVRK